MDWQTNRLKDWKLVQSRVSATKNHIYGKSNIMWILFHCGSWHIKDCSCFELHHPHFLPTMLSYKLLSLSPFGLKWFTISFFWLNTYQEIHQLYEEWLLGENARVGSGGPIAPVLVLDVNNLSIEAIVSKFAHHIILQSHDEMVRDNNQNFPLQCNMEWGKRDWRIFPTVSTFFVVIINSLKYTFWFTFL